MGKKRSSVILESPVFCLLKHQVLDLDAFFSLAGYERLSKDGKMNLLRGGFFKVWLLWSVPRFLSPSRQQLVLNENVSLSFSELSGVYSVEFVRGLFDFAHNWSSLGLNDAEVGLCAGIVLSTMSQTPGLYLCLCMHWVLFKQWVFL